MNWYDFYKNFHNIDYLLFGAGFAFTVLGIFLFIFFKQKKQWFKGTDYILLEVFIIAMGLLAWFDLIMIVFADPNSGVLYRYIFYLIAFLALFEFGKRNIIGNKYRFLFVGYVLALLIIIKLNYFELIYYFAFISMFVAGVGFRVKRKKENIQFKYYKQVNVMLIALSFGLLIVASYIFVNSETYSGYLYLIIHLLIWAYTLIAIALVTQIYLHIANLDPLEYQIRRIRINIVKLTIIAIVIVYIAGFFIVNYLGQKQYAIEKEHILHDIDIATIGLDGKDIQMLSGKSEDVGSVTYKEIENKMEEIQTKFTNAENVYFMIYRNGTLLNGIKTISDWTYVDSYGDKVGRTAAISNVLEKGETVIEDSPNKLTAYAPIKLSNNEIVAILAIDFDVNPMINNIHYERFRGISIVFIAFLLVLAVSGIHFIRLREKAWRTNQLTILSSIEDIVGIFEKNGKLLYANKAANKLIADNNNKNIQSYSLYDFFSEKDKAKLRNIINSFNEDKTVYLELNLVDSNGCQIPIYCSISYLDYVHNDTLFVITAMDRSEQKKREEDMHAHYQNTLSLLATVVDAKDGYTARHSINVAKYAKAIATELNLSDELIKEVETAALVHDIGKIGIHDSMLKKEGALTENEWLEMKKHPEYGKLILEKAGETFEKYIPYVYHHHERYDGKGYPTGMKEPSLLISIISVADALDAMTSDRSYRKGLSLEIAKNELIKNAGIQFHPKVVEALISIIEREGNNFIK